MIANPPPWPNGARCACAITFDMDADSLVHLAQPHQAPTMVSTTSMLRYGPEVAIPRILETYRRLELRQTFFVPGWCAEQYPHAVEAMAKAGHEIGHHGYIHEWAYPNDREQEHYWLQRGIEALKGVTGVRPRGWRAPMYSFSRHSAELLGAEGFLYDSSLMGDDIPYVLESGSSRLVELPSHWGMDDYPQYAHTPELDYSVPVKAPEDAVRNYWNEFEAVYAHGGLLVAVWHPFLTGRLARWHKIEAMLEAMCDTGDVWFAPLEEIANHLLQVEKAGTYQPRADRLPYYQEPVSTLRPSGHV
ncbi:MAG: polysaccharide deacetylase [Ectothiorhodospiraceae bacterium]